MRSTLLCAVFACFVLVASAAVAAGQNTPPSDQAQQTAPSGTAERTSADETFDLNITQRRITRRDYAASTSVEAGEENARGLNLRIGVGVSAREIDVLLRNVHGHVRFRASLDRVLQRINSGSAAPPSP